MDYRAFGAFQKIDPTVLPKTTQEKGLFLLEIRFSPEGTTRSVPVTATVGRSGFGEVARLEIPIGDVAWQELDTQALQALLAGANPPIDLAIDNQKIQLTFLKQPPTTQKTLPGALIFDSAGKLATVLVRLHG